MTHHLIAQTTTISIGSNTIQSPVKRLGINLGSQDNYDSGQMTQNLLFQNPGFEGQIWNSTIRCASGTATSCTDENQYSAWPASFWNGATFEVFYGAAAGRTGTVATSTAPGNGQGVILNFSASGVAPATGDYMIVRKPISGGSTQGWWPSTSGAGQITDNLTDLPPGTLGKQTAALSAPGNYDTATIAGYFDSTSGKSFVQLNGTYQLQFKAKGTGGSNQISLQIVRYGVATYLNQSVTLSGNWNTYNLTFTAAENGSAVGTVGVKFSTVGADSFELDDVSLTSINGDPANTTVFRDPVVRALGTLQPGLIRYWSGQLGDTLDNLLTPQFGRQRAGDSAWYSVSNQIDYGLHDFLALCQLSGAEPWFVVPSTFSTTDAANLIEYLSGSNLTPYGSKRAALGQSAPWTQVFSKIHLEFGNEAWNSTFKGGSIEYPAPYAGRAQAIFTVMRANASYNPSAFDLVLGGQASNPGLNSSIQNNCNNNDSFTVAPYTMSQVDSYLDNESLFGSTFAEPEALISSSGTAEGLNPGMIFQDYQAIQSSSHPVPLSFYEVNLSTLNGAISQQVLNSYTPSLGGGLMVADTMLLSLRQFGAINQSLFALPQYQFNRPDGKTVLLWGAVVDMGTTNRKRPQYLAMELANQAISNGASMLQTVHSGADPTWNEALTNSVQFNGAHYLHSFSFVQGTSHSLIVFNFHRTSTLPVNFAGINAPTGTVQMQQLTSANPTDTNEMASVVNINASTLNTFGTSSVLSLPPYSMTVLTWTGSLANQAPVVSALTVAPISNNSATINWTTDQASTSLVAFGTTPSYGSSSPLNSALTTAHTVTITGLMPGTTYNMQAISVNSAGIAGNSLNQTFNTLPPPPQITDVAFWGVSASGVTISWSTNEPATTAIAYGTTSSLGQITPVQSTLSNTHGVTLTGLNSGTTYYFAAQSADSKGSVGYSTLYSFTTNAGPPVISGIITVPVSGNTAVIAWQTSVPTVSYIVFGLTTAYGKWSASTAMTQYPQPNMGFVPSGTVHYQLHSKNAAGQETVSPDYTFVEP